MTARTVGDEAGPEAAWNDERRQPRGRRQHTIALAIGVAACYSLIACLAYWPVGPLDGRHLVGCVCGDPVQEAWFLNWPPFAMRAGHNPLFTSYLNTPAGANLAVNTSMPLLGLIGWPITSAINSVATYNLLLRLALASSGLSMYLVMRRYVRWWPAAFAAGLLFAFSPYMMGQARSHLFLVFLPLVPPVIPLIDDWLVRPRRGPLISGALLGLLAGLQLLISAEVLALIVIFSGIGVVTLAVRYPSFVRPRLPLLAKGLPVAALVALGVGGYALWMLLLGPQRPTGPIHAVSDLDSYHADLLSPLLPSQGELVPSPVLSRTGEQLVRGSVVENGFYLGAPLVVLLGVMAGRTRQHALILSVGVASLVAFVFGLGTTLSLAGRSLHVPLPRSALTGTPLLQELEPARLSLVLQLGAAVGLGLVLDRLRGETVPTTATGSTGRTASWRRSLLAASVGVIVLVPVAPRLPIKSAVVRIPPFFTSAGVTKLRAGTVALTFPYAYYTSSDAMMWQVAGDMRFRIFGGEAYVPGPTGASKDFPLSPLPPILRSSFVQRRSWRDNSAPSTVVAMRAALREFCLRFHVDAILVHANSAQGRWVSAFVTHAFNAAPYVDGDMHVWLDLRTRLARGGPAGS